jgi:purine nucleoside phosphorylase
MKRLGVKEVISKCTPDAMDICLILKCSNKRCWIIDTGDTSWNKYGFSLISSSKLKNVAVVVIRDHLALPNLTGMNPSFGPHTSTEYSRFIPLGDAYSPRLRRLAFLSSHYLNFDSSALAEGTYAWVAGPAYETPAEGRFLRNAGAHVVGMSTIPEVVAAREEKLEVLVLSLVTNMVVIPDTYRSIKAEVEAEVRYPMDAILVTLLMVIL